MARIVSTFDHTIKIPPGFKKLTGRESFTQEFKAGEAVEVPDHIAEYYTKNWSKKYRYADAEDESIYTPEEMAQGENLPKEFDAMKFLEDNFNNIEEAVTGLTDRKQILEIAKVLKFKAAHNQKNEKLKERIVNDIKVKKAHEEKLAKNEEAKE